MVTNVLRGFGYFFLFLSLGLGATIIVLSFKDTNPVQQLDFWVTVLLVFAYVGGIFMTFWRQLIAGIFFIGIALAVGLPSAILSLWAGAFFGLPPLLAGMAFIAAELYFRSRYSTPAQPTA